MNDLTLYALHELIRGRHLSEVALVIDRVTEEYGLIKQEYDSNGDDQGADLLYIEYVTLLAVLMKELKNRAEELEEVYTNPEDFGV